MKKSLLFLLCLFTVISLQAQQVFPVTDQQPALVNGLQMGYTIKSVEVKAVSDKGDFSRYSVRFYVTNTMGEAKIMLYKQGWNVMGNVSDQLAQFNVLNATGARLTSKQAVINAPACNVIALVDDKDGNNKTVQNKRFVQIGYWIKPGQTISADCILIVPLNDKPNVQVTYLADLLQPAANAGMGMQMQPQQQQYDPNMPPPIPVFARGGYSKIRNIRTNFYINNQDGPVTYSAIKGDWFSAQWQLMPIAGSDVYTIKNRWKNNYIALDNGAINLSGDTRSNAARWTIEPDGDPDTYLIRNLETGGYLCILTNMLKLAKNPNNVATAGWVFEQP